MPSASDTLPQNLQNVPLRRSHFLVWGAAVAVVLVFIGMIVGAPILMTSGYTSAGIIIYKAFSPLCHQISDRSFHLDGHAFAVCARCTGVYGGFAAGVVFYPLLRRLNRTDTPSRIWLFIALVPISIDWTLGVSGVWANTHASRFLTGALLGSVCALFVVPGLMDLLQLDWRRFFSKTPPALQKKKANTLTISRDINAPSDYGSPSSRI